MIVNIFGTWANAAAEHTAFLNAAIDAFLAKIAAKTSDSLSTTETDVHSFILAFRNIIAAPDEVDYSAVIHAFDVNFPPGSEKRAAARLHFEEIFDYTNFSKKDTPGWNAYELCLKSKAVVCPYCHINSTRTVIASDEGKGYRPQLDHYYGKATYPILALSLGNLIPCCATCNGPGFKHLTDFAINPHLHPFQDTENIAFDLHPTNPPGRDQALIEAMRGRVDEYTLSVHPVSSCTKTKASMYTFQLKSRYENERIQAWYFAREIYRQLRAEKLASDNNLLSVIPSRNAMIEAATGVQLEDAWIAPFDLTSDAEYKNYRTGKMLRDIYRAAIERWD